MTVCKCYFCSFLSVWNTVFICDAFLLCMYAYVHVSINMVPYHCCNCRHVSGHVGVLCPITVYCCYCRSHWALPCSCGPSTGPRYWRRHVGVASSRWSGPDLWPPRNCWSDAVGRSHGWLQRHAHTRVHADTNIHTHTHAEWIFNKTFIRILCIQTL